MSLRSASLKGLVAVRRARIQPTIALLIEIFYLTLVCRNRLSSCVMGSAYRNSKLNDVGFEWMLSFHKRGERLNESVFCIGTAPTSLVY